LIDVLDNLGSFGLLPESQWQAPIQDHGVCWSGPRALKGSGDILRFTEVFLGEAPALADFPAPEREIIIGAAMDGFGFESMHVAPVVVANIIRA
jgi:hypothetical protein